MEELQRVLPCSLILVHSPQGHEVMAHHKRKEKCPDFAVLFVTCAEKGTGPDLGFSSSFTS
jgi:hypothetical protein